MKTREILYWCAHFSLIFLITGGSADMIKNISVPQFSFAGDRINLSCVFDLSDTGLYSLKWYHNDGEFYRHIPTENDRPVNIKSGLKFNVYEISRSDRQVTLELASLTSAASGEYKCEVIAEHPSFRTESKAANMTVIEEQPLAPVIEGARESYEEGDEVRLKCIPQTPKTTGQKYSITWYVAGSKARPEFVTPYRDSEMSQEEGLELTATARELASSGSSVDMECHLKLGDFDMMTYERVRIRVKKSNIFANYWSKGVFLKAGATSVLVTLSCYGLLHLSW